jgi:hypothetical protein
MTQEELARLHREAEAALKKIPGVVGVGYGHRERGGKTTSEVAWRVYVQKKKPKSELRPEDMVPAEYQGIETDVLESPKVVDLSCEDLDAYSPLTGGITVTNNKSVTPGGTIGAGTLTCFATMDTVGGPHNIVLLSNNHVLMANGGAVGDTVYQPSTRPGAEKMNPVGKIWKAGLKGLFDFTYPSEGKVTFKVDCCAAQIDICISSWCHTNCGESFNSLVHGLNIGGKNNIADVARVAQTDIKPGQDYVVYKVGRNTSRTVGKITDAMGNPNTDNQNVIVIKATEPNCNGILQFADEGDSGSPLINSNNQIIGILFGKDNNDPTQAFACHIHPVMNLLHVTPVTTAHAPTDNPAYASGTVWETPAIIEGKPNQTPVLRERFLGCAEGKKIMELVEAHRREVVHLVNHNRRVTVAWRRNQGPAFLNRAINNARDPEQRIPSEIEGVTSAGLLSAMAEALKLQGSSALRRAIEQYGDAVIAYAADCRDLHALVDRLEEKAPA